MRPIRMAACALLIALPAAAPIKVAPFHSVALRNGSEIVLRHGPAPGVDAEGAANRSDISVVNGRLIVDNCPARRCRHEDRARLVVTIPRLESVSVSHGGLLRAEGAFPRHSALSAAVEHGGMIDVRAIQADRVAASVNQGGRILARPISSLTASVNQGGNITYWGDPAVQRAVRGGGVVEAGRPGDAAKPLTELGPPFAPLPKLPHPPRTR